MTFEQIIQKVRDERDYQTSDYGPERNGRDTFWISLISEKLGNAFCHNFDRHNFETSMTAIIHNAITALEYLDLIESNSDA